MKPKLILVRHGETEGQSSIRYHGRTDVALSELGRAQMRAARGAIQQHHGHLDFDHVFTSPLIRASEGARLIAGDSAVPSVLEDFVEVHFGLFEGLTAEEIRERYPDHYAQWNADRLAATYTYPGGESRAAFTERVIRGVEKMLRVWQPEADAESTALLVAHRGVIRTTVHHLTGHQPNVELGSIQIVELDGAWRPVIVDQVLHLENIRG
jgi:broad specificity phosphatase PhoE